MSNFVHLHNHSDYSLLDGACRIHSLVDAALEYDMPAVALTDHGNMFGAIEFYKYAKSRGVKPLIGMEAYIAPRTRFEKSSTPGKREKTSYHILLIAENKTGYGNLMKLSSLAYLEGFYYKPRIDKEILRQYCEGLICASGCLNGELAHCLTMGDTDGALAVAEEYKSIFNGNYYLEIQNHGTPEDEIILKEVPRIAEKLDIQLIGTNDCHYLKKEHAEAHDVLLCLQTGKTLKDTDRMKYSSDNFYFKDPDEMKALFVESPEAVKNTIELAERCDVDLETGTFHMPNFPLPEGENTPEEFLEKLVWKGVSEKYEVVDEAIKKRVQHEIDTINSMGFPGYFLIVNDFIRYAKENGIPVGPGRGSATGSVVSYALGITEIDPLKYGLIFERFLNPDRISMPDIDIDFCYERRGEVINYIKERFGKDSVTQIITFGTMRARAAIRDVGRVLNMPYADVDRIAKLIPPAPNVSLEEALEKVPELVDIEKKDETHRKLIEYSRLLEGMSRHASTHAAGVVITPGALSDYVPLYKSVTDDVTTQYDMKMLDTIGLLKMDFLGLRTLTVLQKTLDMLKEKGIDVDLGNISLEIDEIYELFGKGETIGIFQFESPGMKDTLKRLKPTKLEDLIAVNALFRPGPMDNISEFIKRKHGEKKIEYLHPALEPILKETYGIIVYQEQVMRIANELAGLSLSKADIMRSAMGKKKRKLMEEQKKYFLESAAENKLDKKLSKDLWTLLEKFAQYGFNKSHSTAYALIAYRTGYLKVKHPAEFMAATVTSEMTDTDRLKVLIKECKKMGLEIVPPDINSSKADFATDGNKIQYALAAIKNVGVKAANSVIKAVEENSPIRTIFDLVKHVDLRLVNKKVLESLACSGALDSLEGKRSAKFESVGRALEFAQRYQSEVSRGQTSLFGGKQSGATVGGDQPNLHNVEEWSDSERIKNELSAFGFHLIEHQLEKYAVELGSFTNHVPGKPLNGTNKVIKTGGILIDVKVHFDRNNKQMAFCQLEGIDDNTIELLVFTEVYERYKDLIMDESMVLVSGKLSTRDNSDTKLVATEFIPLQDALETQTRSVMVKIDLSAHSPEDIERVSEAAVKFKGNCRFGFLVYSKGKKVNEILSSKISVNPDKLLFEAVDEILGTDSIVLKSAI
ncbi:MAG: DNA polymerase III subunit alpha [Candidatus Marinimicrobia bacterium]|nr:DNA polymerase III subunit alpha [Candidatus Neomarinimicrobiota bacterium]